MKFTILFHVGLFIIVFLYRSRAQHFNNVTDQEALLSFKLHVSSDPNGVLQTWHQNTTMCGWYGVGCNSGKNRVTSLSLKNVTLTGTITPYIGNLSFLRVLDLETNFFSGTIPESIGNLFRLDTLNLASNSIRGVIPLSLLGCSRLSLLDLSSNKLEGSIPSGLGNNLLLLKDLSFMNNNLTGVIPASLGNLSSLNNLILRSNYMHGPIPAELGRLDQLLQLNLGDNGFSGEVPRSLFNISSLIVLSLAKNMISGHLPANLFTMLPNLATLFMGGNLFEGRIPSSLSNATNLQRLDFSTNGFSGGVPLLWNLRNIIILNLEINQLTSEGETGLDFITSLTNSSSLQVFSLATNQFTCKFPSSIGNLSSELSLFVMAQNHFRGSIPESVGNLQSLTLLSLESNSFTGMIPSSIGKLQNLQKLYMDMNYLSGSIPPSLGNLSELYELGLSQNNLTGSILSSLSNCQHIQYLDVSDNSLDGEIPKEIFSFPSLGLSLNLSSNLLTGSLPSEIGKLKMVQRLDISRNKLSGTIPSTIGECSNLLYLYLSRNSFQGLIPNTLVELKGLEYIDLSSNNLSGPIPSLDTLKYLKLLNLSNNELQGEVPKQGVFLNSSEAFLDKNAGLCGGVQELRLPKCAANTKRRHRKSKTILIVVVCVSAGVFILLSLSLFMFLLVKRKRRQSSSTENDLVSFDGADHKFHSYYDLKSATNDFNVCNLIGRGSFGNVYKGVFKDGTSAAIKVFDMDQSGALKSFLAECEALRNIRHRNLIKIVSACSNRDFKALVLEFMPNGSLEKWIHQLSLKQRLEIAVDVAAAMEYLHHECQTPVVHCDLKPSNVLLDQNMTAHVGDFGLAKMFHETASNPGVTSSTFRLKGSIGYVAPEYGLGGQVSAKGDVYSYGILLLELITGKRPTEEIFSGELTLQSWVRAALPDRVVEILDNKMMEECQNLDTARLVSVMEIGLLCANKSPEDRPKMNAVSSTLKRTMSLIFDNVSGIIPNKSSKAFP